ncbi:MAG: NUDIX hydrolase [Mycobacteriales bacterium]
MSRARSPRPRLRTVAETSAGGLVVDRTELTGTGARAALIGRRSRGGDLLWSLPKGHVESGETTEEAALREVAEETGITGKIIEPLGTIDFWFVAEGKRIHKTVHHYLMVATGGEISDEDIEVEAVDWVPLSEIDTRLAYDDERALAERARSMLARSA